MSGDHNKYCSINNPKDEWKEITDPEELFKLKREEWEIQYHRQRFDDADGWYAWDQASWNNETKFRARPRQPKMKKVKYECWEIEHRPEWLKEGYYKAGHTWIRQPHLDLEGEVPE